MLRWLLGWFLWVWLMTVWFLYKYSSAKDVESFLKICQLFVANTYAAAVIVIKAYDRGDLRLALA